MGWLNEWITHWTPVLWISATGVLLLTWYLVRRSSGRREIREAALEVHRRRLLTGELSEEEFSRLKESLTGS